MLSSATQSDLWIRRYHPSSADAIRLVCFPHAGGAANYFFALSKALSPAIEVLAVQYPGRQDRRHEGCIENIPDLADQIFDALQHVDHRPFAFFGHSMGAILAFEVAERFQRRGTAPVRLFVSGRRAPSRYRDETLHCGDNAGLIAELQEVGGTDQVLLNDPEMLDIILQTVRADYKAIETYTYQSAPQLECAITALVGDSDPKVTSDEASAWADHCAGDFNMHRFPGGHFFIESCRSEVISTISGSLESARTARPTAESP